MELRHVNFALLAIVVLVTAGMSLEGITGLPFDTFYRIACAIGCLVFIFQFRSDFPGERWPGISLWAAALFNVGVFFSPFVDRPASRGELMLFALPDAIIVLTAAIATYRVTSDHQRAIRQQMILALIVAAISCVGLGWSAMIVPPVVHSG